MTTTPPTEAPPRAERRVRSLVLLHTGDGKGKTSAAMGVAMRAAGHGRRVAVVQFLKSGRWRSGERIAAERLGIRWSVIGDGFTWDSEDLDRAAEIARTAWAEASTLVAAGEHDVVVLDEMTYPLTWGWVPTDDVAVALRGGESAQSRTSGHASSRCSSSGRTAAAVTAAPRVVGGVVIGVRWDCLSAWRSSRWARPSGRV